jgi:hypothetical protein
LLWVGYFVLDVLLETVGVGTDQATSIHEDGGGATNIEELGVGDAGINCGGGLGAAHAGLEGIGVHATATSIIHHLVVGIRGGEEFLVVIDQVIHFPEGFGVLLISATASQGGGACPRVDGLDRKVLEDDLDLGVFGQKAPERVMEVAADRAFEVRVLDDGNGGIGITEDRSIPDGSLFRSLTSPRMR